MSVVDAGSLDLESTPEETAEESEVVEASEPVAAEDRGKQEIISKGRGCRATLVHGGIRSRWYYNSTPNFCGTTTRL
jgi:hypothetical protein